MIVTVTLNAALDRSLTVPIFQLGHRHRASEVLTLAGGKGINVARALKRLDVPVDYVRFQLVADIVTDDHVDFTVTNATPARANDVSFSQPVLSIELGLLAARRSRPCKRG